TMGNALAGMGRDINISDDLRYQAAAFINHMQNSDQYTLILNQNNNNNQGASDLGANQFGGMRMNRGSGGGISESTNLMFRVNKELSETAMLNGDIRYNRRDQFSETTTETTEFTEKSTDFSQSRSTNKYLSNNISANLRFDWKPDTLNTLVFEPNLRYNNSKSSRETPYNNQYDYDTMDLQYEANSESHTKGEGIAVGGNLTYSHSFKNKRGRNFTFRLGGNYNDNYSWENSYSYALTYKEEGNKLERRNQRSENDQTSNNFNANISWVEPLGHNNFLQANYRVSYRDTKSLDTTYDMTDEYGTEFEEPWWEKDLLLLASVNSDQSRSTERNSFEQRIGVNMRMHRERYNVSFGFNVVPSRSTTETYQPSADSFDDLFMPYPYDSRLANLRGDSLISSIKQNVTNFSPTLNFNYNWDRQTRLRIDYNGETNQPSASQLRDYIDKNNIKSWSMGNPNLKPGFTSSLRAHFNKYVQESQLTYNFFLSGQYSVNDITSVSYRSKDKVRLTTYENISGNWNTNLRGMFNIPLKNKKFSVSSSVRVGYDHRKSYISGEDVEDLETANLDEIKVKNTGNNLSLSDRSSINYRSDLFDIGLNLSISYNDISYSAQPEKNQETYNYGVGGYTTWYLPYKWTLESDINFTKREGYTSEEHNISETMWNAAVTKVLFSKKYG
ncbi:outer membrane beta-barrel family protein, partial [Bacteroidales bacterium OttesenSCG-928-J19]|nr:outer membrane beta-barrel family protein [Bacteroidales bacterium OttesenSCG-928-J19]